MWVGIDTIVAESGWKHEAVERALRWLAHHGLLANVGYRDRSRLRQLLVDWPNDLPASRGRTSPSHGEVERS